jgi:aminopeptidase N
VLDIARSFTRQPGFPVLSARATPCTRIGDRSANIAVSQRRFAMDDASRTDELWTIPVVARRLGDDPTRAVLEPQAEATIEVAPPCSPYLMNAGQSGFFRVLYDDANLQALRARFGELQPIDQLGLLLDYWAFGRSGDAPFTAYLELESALSPQADQIIVMDTAGSMLALHDYAKGRPSEAMVAAYGRRSLRRFFDEYGWGAEAGELANDARARATLIAALGALGDEAIIAEARRRVRASAANPAGLPAALRTATLGVFAAHASEADYEFLLSRARGARDFVEQRRLWNLLAAAEDPALARRTLQLTLGDDIPRQIRTQVIANVSGSHPRIAWDFLVANRATVEALLDPLQRLEFPADLASGSTDPAMVGELRAYARDFPEGARPTIDAATATITLRAQTVAERMPAVEAWIAAREPSRTVRRMR